MGPRAKAARIALSAASVCGLMIAFLYSLSDLSVAILFGSGVALVFAIAPLLRVRLFGHVSEAIPKSPVPR